MISPTEQQQQRKRSLHTANADSGEDCYLHPPSS